MLSLKKRVLLFVFPFKIPQWVIWCGLTLVRTLEGTETKDIITKIQIETSLEKDVIEKLFENQYIDAIFRISVVSLLTSGLSQVMQQIYHMWITPDILFSTSFNWQSEQCHENKKPFSLFFQTIGFHFMTFFECKTRHLQNFNSQFDIWIKDKIYLFFITKR